MARRRKRNTAPPPKAYRLHFFYEPLGRYFRSSKRRLYWSFGFTDINAVRSGKTGNDCRGEEHEVELVWSLKSGKTRVYWNRRNISNLFRQDPESDSVNISWNTQSGEVLQVVAYKDAMPGVAQYDLLIDGVSFYGMPNVVELGNKEVMDSASEHKEQPEESTSSLDECEARLKSIRPHNNNSNSQGSHLESSGSELDSFQSLTDRHPCDGLGYRLSMVGLSSGGLTGVDELHSEVYSPILESLRQRIVECLPQTEEMISRSIIQTFFPDYVSQHSEDILSSMSGASEELDPQQIEADALFEAYEWAGLNTGRDHLLTRPRAVRPRDRTWSAPAANGRSRADESKADMDELGYMQKLIDSIFIKVRNEDVSSDEGARILLGVAAVLRLEFTNSLPMDTIVLDNLDPCVTVQDLRDALGEYGDLEAVAISMRCPSFGFCRFMGEGSLQKLLDADREGEFYLAGGIHPRLIALTEKMRDLGNGDSKEENRIASPTPPQQNHRGSPSTIPHLMGAWTDDDGAQTEPVVVTPEHPSSAFPQPKSSYSSPRSTISLDF